MKLYDELCARKTELIRNRKRIEKGLNGAPKMDDPDYANKTVSKTNLFLSGGYFLGENFIFTAESVKLPISVKQIRKMIEHYCV